MAGWRRSELKSGVYDEIVSARLDRQLAELGPAFEVHRAALTETDPIGAVLESLIGDGFALALAELKASSTKGLALAEALLAVLRSHAPRVFERDDVQLSYEFESPAVVGGLSFAFREGKDVFLRERDRKFTRARNGMNGDERRAR